jgi:hypothetical protein
MVPVQCRLATASSYSASCESAVNGVADSLVRCCRGCDFVSCIVLAEALRACGTSRRGYISGRFHESALRSLRSLSAGRSSSRRLQFRTRTLCSVRSRKRKSDGSALPRSIEPPLARLCVVTSSCVFCCCSRCASSLFHGRFLCLRNEPHGGSWSLPHRQP